MAKDTPLETELVFSPSGERMVGLVRMDGTDFDLLGFQGRLRTKVCWARRPYVELLLPPRAEGRPPRRSVEFWWRGRLFVIGQKHLRGEGIRKRTALWHGELPSAGGHVVRRRRADREVALPDHLVFEPAGQG